MANRVVSIVFCVFCYATVSFHAGIVSAQEPEPPISNEACDALKMIAAGTTSGLPALIAMCSVQSGCATLNCTTSGNGYAVLTFQPCSNPPAILTHFYDSNDVLSLEQALTPRTAPYNIPIGDNTFSFTIQDTTNGISIKVDASTSTIPGIPYIPETTLHVSETLCGGFLPNTTTNMSTMYSTMSSSQTQQQVSTITITTTTAVTPSTVSSSTRTVPTTSASRVSSTVTPSASVTESPRSGCTKMSPVSLPALALLMLLTVYVELANLLGF